MNRNYKVIWNNALNCFTAVAEYAKARGKSSKSSVSSNARINTTSKHSSTGILRSSAIGIGMMVAGFGIQANAAPPVPLCVGMTSVECGINANANPYYAIAIGKHAQADGVLSTAVGTHARSKGVASSAFGAGAFATEHGSVALGAGSRTDSAATSEKVMTVGGETYKIAGNVLYHNNTLMPGAQVSVGSAGFERQIKNVAGGKVSKTSTDAVNGSQLHATNTTINRGIKFNVNDTHKKTFALGEEIKFDTDANLTTTPLSTNDGIKLALNDVVNIGTKNPVKINGKKGTVSGLTNTTFDETKTYKNGLAATQEQLSQVNTDINTTINRGIKFNVNDTHKKTFALGEEIKFDTDANLTTTPLSTNDGIKLALNDVVNIGTKNPVKINGKKGTVSGLTNTTFDETKTYKNGLAATQEQLSQVNTDINTTINRGIKFNVNDTHKKTFALGEEIKFDTDANLTTTPLSTNDGIKLALNDVVNIGTKNPVKINGKKGTVSGLTNTTFDETKTYKNGLAATQEQLSQVNSNINSTIGQGLSFTGDNTNVIVKRQLGETLSIKGGATELTDNNIGVVADADGNLNVKLAENIDLGENGRFMIGNTLMNQDGFTFISQGSVDKTVMLSSSGLNNGGNKIINVAAGEDDMDAVNVEQLNAVKNSADTANKGWDISAQGGNVSTVKPTDTVDFNSKDTNIAVSKDASSHDISFELNKELVIESVKAGDSFLDTNGLTIDGGPTFTKTKVDVAGNKITSVADGTVAADSKDAVNGGQLHDVVTSIEEGSIVINQKIETNTTNIQNNADKLTAGLNFGADNGNNINKPIGDDSVLGFVGGNNITTTTVGSSIRFDLNGNINVDSVTTGSVVAGNTTINNNGVTIAGGPSMTVDGINAGGKVITGVADGVKDTDAVNRGQLNNQFDTIDRLINSELANMDSKLDDRVNSLGYRIDDVEDDANAGISAAMAMSSLPQAYIPGKSMIGGGIASYNGESAVAIGVSRVSDNGRWVMKINGTADTQGNAGGAIGAGFHF
ncbi:YadA-like family protein [Psychrobacter sp. H8-1]|uniref:YadA-like family protein n=1 Tax=Psychrobacter sp. H8-1 TaxID=2774129 RepID=UPI001919B539|nr:YadA-like family protein [Psychrobacter sp. H8-1]